MRHHLITLLAAVLLAGGCSMTPDYTPPAAPVPENWPSGEAYRSPRPADDTPAVAEIPWQAYFTDPRLRQVIASALDNNRDLRLAALAVQQARAVYGIQRAQLYPAVSAGAAGAIQRLPADLSSTGQARTAERYDVNLGIAAWEIDLFGRLRSLKESALESYLATEEARRSTQVLLVAAVADAYLALAADRENRTLARTTLDAQQKAYDLIRRRFEVGMSSALDLYRAQTQLDAARRDIARYSEKVAKDVNALNLLVGSKTPVSPDDLPENLADVGSVAAASPGISSEVLLNRPDIVAAEHALKAVNADIGAARAALFPRISLTTTLGTASASLSGLFASGSEAWTFVPQATVPIFDPRLWSALDVTKAQRDIALTRYEKAIQTAFREVADALAGRGTLTDQVAAQQSLVDAAGESYRLAAVRYEKGVDSYLGVLDAQRTLYAAEQILVGLRLAERSNQVRLYAVLGGGAPPAPESMD